MSKYRYMKSFESFMYGEIEKYSYKYFVKHLGPFYESINDISGGLLDQTFYPIKLTPDELSFYIQCLENLSTDELKNHISYIIDHTANIDLNNENVLKLLSPHKKVLENFT